MRPFFTQVCGGNDVRPDDQPQDGDSKKLVIVRETEPREDFEVSKDDACGATTEDSFDPTKINGDSLEPCPEADAASGELTAKNRAGFDGAFLSFKVSTGSAKPKVTKADKVDLANAVKDKVAKKMGVKDAPDLPGGSPSTLGGMPVLSGLGGAGPPRREFDWDGEIKADNYFVMQARIVFLCFTMEIDIRIIPGPVEDGGGIHAKFTFLWAIGNVELTYICAQIDVVPFDFSAKAMAAMAADPEAWFLSIYIYLGVEIRPGIINVIMEFIEPALKIVLMAILIPLAVAVFVVQKILEYAIKFIELGKKAVKMAEDALDEAEKAAGKALNKIASGYLRYQRMEDTANIAGKMTASTCRKSFGKNKNNGCIIYNGKEKCTWQMDRGTTFPKDCDKLIAKWRANAAAWREQCCGFWTMIKRVFLKILYVIAKIIVYIILLIPRILLKILEAILIIAAIALKLAEMAVKIALCLILAPFNNHKEVLDSNHQISIPKMIKWIWNVQILRVWELAVAARFEEGALSLSARADFVFFGTHMDLRLTFSLDFKDLVAGFAITIADLMSSIMTLFGGMAQCIADVVTSGAKKLVSLGWAKEPQPRLAGDISALPKLGMGHGGSVVRQLHVDHAVADFAKRHATKLGGASHPYPHRGAPVHCRRILFLGLATRHVHSSSRYT